jgi:hypothetical protein
MPKGVVKLELCSNKEIGNSRARRQDTVFAKLCELMIRCKCDVATLVVWRNEFNKATRVYIVDSNTNGILETLRNLDDVPVVYRYDREKLIRLYHSNKKNGGGGVELTKLKGRTPQYKNVRNEDQVPPTTVFDLIAECKHHPHGMLDALDLSTSLSTSPQLRHFTAANPCELIAFKDDAIPFADILRFSAASAPQLKKE